MGPHRAGLRSKKTLQSFPGQKSAVEWGCEAGRDNGSQHVSAFLSRSQDLFVDKSPVLQIHIYIYIAKLILTPEDGCGPYQTYTMT